MGQLRIIAGLQKGRKISVPSRPGLRPTPDRVREALFDILGEHVAAARVLDLYSGSGALGFEALSRGARHVFFVESDAATAGELKATAERLGLASRCAVRKGPVAELLGVLAARGPFDLVMADPPYSPGIEPRLLARLCEPSVLAPGGRLVVERSSRCASVQVQLAGVTLVRTSVYGDTSLDFYEGPDGRPG